jgi:hypothetical protein
MHSAFLHGLRLLDSYGSRQSVGFAFPLSWVLCAHITRYASLQGMLLQDGWDSLFLS